MVTVLVTAVIPGIRNTKEDNNSSKQFPFVKNKPICGSSLAGGTQTAGATHCNWAKDGVTQTWDMGLFIAGLVNWIHAGRSAPERGPRNLLERTMKTFGSFWTDC